MNHRIFLWSLAILGSVCVLFIALVAASPNAPNLAAMIGLNTGADCENPSAIRILKDLARSKLTSSNYLLPRVTIARPPPPAGSPLSYLSATELITYQSEVQKILTFAQVVVSSGQGTLILTPLAIRDRGSLASGRTCAAFVKVALPSMGSTPALVFEIAASYTVERTRDDQIVVTASFFPKQPE